MTRLFPQIEALVAALMVVAMAVTAFFYLPQEARANQSTFCYGESTSAATSSPNYMTPGTATTTLTTSTRCASRDVPLDSLVATLQLIASSSTSRINGGIEQSMDGIEWYPASTNLQATTSPSYTLDSAGLFSLGFASSTPGGAIVPSYNNRITRLIDMPTNMPYARIWLANSIGAGRVAVWAQFIGQRQSLAR